MQQITKIFGDENFITTSDGQIESVLISYSDYRKILDLYEDQALALAINEFDDDTVYDKSEALKILENDEN